MAAPLDIMDPKRRRFNDFVTQNPLNLSNIPGYVDRKGTRQL